MTAQFVRRIYDMRKITLLKTKIRELLKFGRFAPVSYTHLLSDYLDIGESLEKIGVFDPMLDKDKMCIRDSKYRIQQVEWNLL